MYEIFRINKNETPLKKSAEDLLYHVLWAPYGISQNKTGEIFEKNQQNNPFYIAIKSSHPEVLGCIVTNEIGFNFKIKHLAVKNQFQGKGIGNSLVNHVLNKTHGKKVEVIARNTSANFWEKLGFIACGKWIKHPLFTNHGIIFRKYCYNPNI